MFLQSCFSHCSTHGMKDVIVEDINVAINNGRVLVKLAKDFSLDKVREKLEINDIISNLISFYFTKNYSIIGCSNEHEFNLSDILDGDTIYLKEDSQPNWKKLAFTIKDCELNILDDFNSYPITTSSVNDLFKNRGLFLNPQLDLDFLIDPQNSRSYDSEQVSGFNIQNFVKAILSINKKDIIITEEFEVAVKEALNSQDINILKHAIEKFGQFVPTEIMFGGRLHYELTTYTGSTIQLEDTFIFGGDKIKIELIGKTIIYSNIQYYEFKIHDYNDESNNIDLKARNIVDLKARIIDSIFSNKDTDPQVFATVSNIEDDDNDNIFTCMLCTPSDLSIPKLIINCTRYKSDQQKVYNVKIIKIRISWIIVGYDFNSIFSPEHFYLQSTTRDCNHNDDASHEKVLNIRTEYSTILFGIPVVLEWNPSFKHSIIGHHFSSNDDKVDICLYKYDLSEKKYFTRSLSNFKFNILYTKHQNPDIFRCFKVDKDLSLKMILESDKNLFISLHKEGCNQSDPGFIRRKNGQLFIKQPDGHISQDHFVVGVFNPGFKAKNH
ncbi:hypothetical protein F8M41_005046 [Gigaspora margarita]|uniref:DUF7431 domain-containing protein n=1 Tax=Gigaspora margarita TaxID=4874 RepID=A0A8H4AXN5_GIGMA|nr:hypothetical protein F8M41_005046 [Gigaspora margarita]